MTLKMLKNGEQITRGINQKNLRKGVGKKDGHLFSYQ
jgi:hypothetical protein